MEVKFKMNVYKTVEIDTYKNGIIEGGHEYLYESFQTEFFSSLIGHIITHYELDENNVLESLENYENYIIFQKLENESGDIPSKKEMTLFENNEINLYACTYQIFIERVIINDFSYYEYSMLENEIKKNIELKKQKKAV